MESFSLAALNAHPDDLATWDTPGARKRVAVIGGGIAGLTAAYELEQLGHHVTVFEASKRLGGRIWTHYFTDGTHAEFGATRIGVHHGCVMHYIRRFGVATAPFVAHNPCGLYHIGGLRTSMNKAAQLWTRTANRATEQRSPDELYEEVVDNVLADFGPDDLTAMFTAHQVPQNLGDLDAVSFTKLFEDRLSPDAFRLVGHATGMIHYARVSALGGLIDELNWRAGKHVRCTAGMQTLIQAFVERIQGPIHCGMPVEAIRISNDGVTLRTAAPSHTHRFFDHVISTVPTTALVRIQIEPPLPKEQAEAVAKLTYSPAARTIAHVPFRRWEREDGIFAGRSYTDLSIQQVWYPDDNARAIETNAGVEWQAIDSVRSKTPAAFVAAYRWETYARRFASLPLEQRDSSTLKDLARLHPDLDDDVDELLHVVWDEEISPGTGAYAIFRPGERDVLQPHLGTPWPREHPRLFFAGEHLNISHASIQGAIRTALDAARGVLCAPTPTSMTKHQ